MSSKTFLALYIVLGTFWVLGSDYVVTAENVETMRFIQNSKGLIFLFVSGWCIYSLIKQKEKWKKKSDENAEQLALLLNESQQTYQSLFENTPDLVYVLDLEGNFVESNPQFEKVTGYNRDDYIRKSPVHLVLEEFGSPMIKGIEQALAGSVVTNEVRVKKKDGTIMDVHTTFFPMMIDGKVKGVYCYGRDITQLRETEQCLRNAEKFAVLGELAAGIAHEIRNPLTSMRGFVQLMESSHENNPFYCRIILQEIDRINSIVGDLLVLAKPQQIYFTKCNIEEILTSVVDLLTPQTHLYGAEMFMETIGNIPDIECESNQLKQVFINIIKNSIEAEATTIKINLSKLKDHVIVVINDNGCGMKEDRMKHLGEPFYSLKEKGTGLGLTVSHKILEAHQATINYSSEVGKGTEVEIKIPIHQK